MAKKKTVKPQEKKKVVKRASKYENKLHIKGTLDDVLKVSAGKK